MDTIADPTDFVQAPVNKQLTPEEKIDLLTTMVRIRQFETLSLGQYQAGKIGGFLHLYNGQESVAVGVVSLMGENDHIITAYRDHGHALAVGMSMNECMAELFGKATGCSQGKGGSMHFFAPDKNYWGGHGIVAGQTPLGLGLAYALKYKELKGCALCFLGDGAVNQGVYHESLNLASLWDIPVIYVIENNGYSMGTSQTRSSAYKNCLAERADSYGIIWDLVNGHDLYEVRAKTHIAIERAYNESRPSVLEMQTYRYYGHSVADANHKKYRTPEEIKHYHENYDPINVWHHQLDAEGLLDDARFKEIENAAKQEVKQAIKFANESPFPTVDDITKHVYKEVDDATEAGRTGRHFFHS